MRKLLQPWAARRRMERKRRLEAVADLVVAAQVVAAEVRGRAAQDGEDGGRSCAHVCGWAAQGWGI